MVGMHLNTDWPLLTGVSRADTAAQLTSVVSRGLKVEVQLGFHSTHSRHSTLIIHDSMPCLLKREKLNLIRSGLPSE